MIKEASIFLVLTLLALWWAGAFHIIDSGHIGVYKRGGAMLDSWTEPGLHFMVPFITKYFPVQVTLQTDQVKNIPCGTSSGVILNFEKIEVVNRLRKELAHQTIKNYTVTYDQTWIFSKIHHEINQFCSSHTLQEVLIDKFTVLD
jgi:regulator of protease activity HflC (stomatin/prohibitin superfamily)